VISVTQSYAGLQVDSGANERFSKIGFAREGCDVRKTGAVTPAAPASNYLFVLVPTQPP